MDSIKKRFCIVCFSSINKNYLRRHPDTRHSVLMTQQWRKYFFDKSFSNIPTPYANGFVTKRDKKKILKINHLNGRR